MCPAIRRPNNKKTLSKRLNRVYKVYTILFHYQSVRLILCCCCNCIVLISFLIFADVTGVEPAPNCVTGRHLNRLTSHPYFCLSGRVRTYDLRVPNSPLYQTELHLVFENSSIILRAVYDGYDPSTPP